MSTGAKNTLNIQNKKLHIECLRIVAAFLVIVNHTNSRIFLGTQPSALWYTSLWYFFESKIAVPLFVMIMGAVLLSKQDSFKKYLWRICRIAAVTAVITVLFGVISGYGTDPAAIIGSVLNSKAQPHWYLYLYLGLLLILPFMQKLAQALDKNELLLLILLTVVIGGFAPMLQYVGLKIHDAFYYALFSPYIGMAFAGFYIEKYLKPDKKQAWLALGGFAALVLAQVLVTAKSYNTRGGVDYLWLDNAKFAPIALSAICFYIVIKYIFSAAKTSEKSGRAICGIGSLTFGIYLVGDLFKSPLEFVFTTLSAYITPMPAMIIYQLCIFICAAAVTAVLKFIPVIKKFI